MLGFFQGLRGEAPSGRQLLFDFCVMVYWGMAAMSTETQVGKTLVAEMFLQEISGMCL